MDEKIPKLVIFASILMGFIQNKGRMMFDICVNLHSEQFDKDRFDVIQRAFNHNISYLGLIGSCLESSKMALEIHDQFPTQTCATVGLHPHSAKDFCEELWNQMKILAQKPEIKAIGECGLDYNRNFSPVAIQQECFRAHIQLATDLNKPLFLHQRDAFEDFIQILDEAHPQVPIVVHCFTDGPKELQAFIDRGYYIGITGWIADNRRNEHLLKAIAHLPLNRVMIETDAPWLTPRNIPQFRKIRRNEPMYLPFVVQALAQHMNCTEADIIQHSTQNALTFFGLTSLGS